MSGYTWGIACILSATIGYLWGWRRGVQDGYNALRFPNYEQFSAARKILDAERVKENLLTIQEEYQYFSQEDQPYKTGWLGFRP